MTDVATSREGVKAWCPNIVGITDTGLISVQNVDPE